MKKIVFALCIVLAACSGNKDDNECLYLNIAEVIGEQPEEIALDKWAKSVRMIPLETNDSVLISNIRNVIIHKNRLIVQDRNRLVVFDMSGKYLFDIGKKGKGPGEYAFIRKVILKGDTVLLLDEGGKMHLYDWEGHLIKDKRFPCALMDIFPVQGSDMLVSYFPNLTGKTTTKMIFFHDTVGVDSLLYEKTYPNNRFAMMFPGEGIAFKSGNRTAFKELFNDTIFTFDKNLKLHPYIILDFGKYREKDDTRYTVTKPRAFFETTICPSIVGETKNYLFLTGLMDMKSRCYYYDKKEGKVHHVSWKYPENKFAFSEDKTFIPKKFSEDNNYMIGYESQENDENPVIILAEVP